MSIQNLTKALIKLVYMKSYSLAMYIKDHNLINKAFMKIIAPFYFVISFTHVFLKKRKIPFLALNACIRRVTAVHPILF